MPKNEVSSAVTELVQLRARRNKLAEQANGEQTKDVEAADAALAKEDKKIAKLREIASQNLETVRGTLSVIGGASDSRLRPKAKLPPGR